MAQKHPDELKAQVIGEWAAGASYGDLSARHNVPKSSIQRWVDGRTRILPIPKPNGPDEETIDDIAWDWTIAQKAATIAILRKATDDSWLSGQNAHDLGVFYGIIADKQLRLLAAFRPREFVTPTPELSG